jgi:L-fuconolactonase
LEHLASILARNRFEGSILVGPAAWPAPAAEMVLGIVPLFDPDLLDGYQREPRFRGVWQHFDSAIPDALEELERRGIPLDADAPLDVVRRIADRFPGLRIVIDDLGTHARGDWAHDLELAAEVPNVYCKLSGLTRLQPSPRPYVQHALAVFGPGRLMFGSGWPDSLPDFTWKASLAAFTQAIGAQTMEVREQLLGGTAARFYGLNDKLE